MYLHIYLYVYTYTYIYMYIGQVVNEPVDPISTEEQITVTDNVDEVLIEEQALVVASIADRSFTFKEELNCYEEESEVCILYLNTFINTYVYI
jgi:hypothetical protein